MMNKYTIVCVWAWLHTNPHAIFEVEAYISFFCYQIPINKIPYGLSSKNLKLSHYNKQITTSFNQKMSMQYTFALKFV